MGKDFLEQVLELLNKILYEPRVEKVKDSIIEIRADKDEQSAGFSIQFLDKDQNSDMIFFIHNGTYYKVTFSIKDQETEEVVVKFNDYFEPADVEEAVNIIIKYIARRADNS